MVSPCKGAEELGNWHRDCAVEMKTNRETFPKWSCEALGSGCVDFLSFKVDISRKSAKNLRLEKWKFEGCATSVVQVDLALASLMGFEYKYYCVRRDGRGEWEPRGNRSFIKPESGNVVKDGAFGDPDPGSSKVRQTVPRVQITSFKSVSTTESTSPSFEL